MKLLNKVAVLFFLFYIQLNGFGITRIYLVSEAEIKNGNLKVSDICKMEGDSADKIANIILSPELYTDSIIDSRELYNFLSQKSEDKLFILGSGVRIKKGVIKKEEQTEKATLVSKGEMVELSIRKNGITIEMKGKALHNGCEKDEIDFRLSTGKVVKGKIISLKKAEIIL